MFWYTNYIVIYKVELPSQASDKKSSSTPLYPLKQVTRVIPTPFRDIVTSFAFCLSCCFLIRSKVEEYSGVIKNN